MPSPQERFAHRLRTAMEQKYGPGAKAAQLARDTGLSEQTLSRWLKAKVVPTPALLSQLAPALDVPLAEWLRIAGILEPAPASPADARYPQWAAWLAAALAAADATVERFAERAQIEVGTVRRMLAGETAPHSADLAIDIAHVLAGDTVAALAAAGHPKTAEALRASEAELGAHPIIAHIQADDELTDRQKADLIAEVKRRQLEELMIFEQRVRDAVRDARAQRDRETGPEGNHRAVG
jgi:transcriptional regulator with XRE-family HTH domain